MLYHHLIIRFILRVGGQGVSVRTRIDVIHQWGHIVNWFWPVISIRAHPLLHAYKCAQHHFSYNPLHSWWKYFRIRQYLSLGDNRCEYHTFSDKNSDLVLMAQMLENREGVWKELQNVSSAKLLYLVSISNICTGVETCNLLLQVSSKVLPYRCAFAIICLIAKRVQLW
jgi:hypothetical protein